MKAGTCNRGPSMWKNRVQNTGVSYHDVSWSGVCVYPARVPQVINTALVWRGVCVCVPHNVLVSPCHSARLQRLISPTLQPAPPAGRPATHYCTAPHHHKWPNHRYMAPGRDGCLWGGSSWERPYIPLYLDLLVFPVSLSSLTWELLFKFFTLSPFW